MGVDISFIIPLHNKEPYIKRCVESIMAQKLDSYEIWIIDDGSTDQSFDRAMEYERYDHIHIRKNKKNLGAAYTRNVGIESAHGQYIWFVDADDYIGENEADRLLDIMKNSCLDVVCFDVQRENKYGKASKKLLNVSHTNVISGEELFCQIGDANTMRASACGQIYRVDYIRENKLKFSEGMIAEDAFFSIRALLMAPRTMYVSSDAYVYADIRDSVTYGTPDYEFFIGTFYAYCEMREFWEKFVTDPKVGYYLIPFISSYYKIAKDHFRLEDLKKIRKWARDCRQYIYNQYRMFECTELKGHYLGWLNDEQILTIQNQDQIIVYGAGNIAHELLPFLQLLDKKIIAYAVSENMSKRRSWYGVPIVPICSLAPYKNEALVIVAVSQKYYREIRTVLQKYEFKKILWLFEETK